MQQFRGGLAFKAHSLCVSLNSRLESDYEEEEEKGVHCSKGRGLFSRTGLVARRCCLTRGYRCTSLIRNRPPCDPTVGLCLGPYGGPMGVAFFYARGSPVMMKEKMLVCAMTQGGGHDAPTVRVGSWMGPPQGKRAPRVGPIRTRMNHHRLEAVKLMGRIRTVSDQAGLGPPSVGSGPP